MLTTTIELLDVLTDCFDRIHREDTAGINEASRIIKGVKHQLRSGVPLEDIVNDYWAQQNAQDE